MRAAAALLERDETAREPDLAQKRTALAAALSLDLATVPVLVTRLHDAVAGTAPDYLFTDAPIDIESFSWGATNSGGTGAGGGSGAGKVSLQDFHFVIVSGAVSPQLFEACATGKHFRTAVITVRKAGKETQDYYRIKLEDVLISSFQSSGSAGSLPVDQVSMNFGSVEFV